MSYYDDELYDDLFVSDDENYGLTKEENDEIEKINQEELDKIGGYPKTVEEFKKYNENLKFRLQEYFDNRKKKNENKMTKLDIRIQEYSKKYPPLPPEIENSEEFKETMRQFYEDGEKIKYSMEKIRERRANPENYTMEKMIEMAEQVDRDAKDFKDVYELTKNDGDGE